MDKYGPQTEEIKKFLERVRELTPEQADELKIAWNAAEDASWTRIEDAAWNAAWNAGRDTIWDSIKLTAWNAVRDAVRDAAWGAIWNASLALVVKDKISEKNFSTLYGPWKSVMEK